MNTYRCSYCNALFKLKEYGGNDTDIIYCPNCGHDTLVKEMTIECSVDWCKHFDNWKCTLKNPIADEESCFDYESEE